MAEFVLKNNSFKFNSNVNYQTSGTVNGMKFVPLYTCIYMNYIEDQFLKNEQIQPWIWFRYMESQ